MSPRIRTSVYLSADVYHALRASAAEFNCSMSDIVNSSLEDAFLEDAADIAVCAARASEPEVDMKTVLGRASAETRALLAILAIGEAQLKAGKVKPAVEVIAKVRRRRAAPLRRAPS